MVTKPLFPQSGEILNDDSVWQDSVSIDGPPDRPPAYDQHPKQLQVLGADHPSTGTYDDSEGHSRSIILEEEDVKYDQMEFLRARQNSPLTSPSGSSHLDFSPTSSSSNRSRFHATPHPSRSSTTFIPGSLTKVQNDICKVVLDLLQEVVRQAHLPTSLDMLESCASTCHAHRIPFSALLQEASIAGHTPFYWVIVRWKGLRIGIGNRDHGGELLDHLIAFAAPLVPSTVADLRLGCLHLGPEAAGDRRSGNVANAVLQRLRRNPLVNAPSASDAILLEPVLESTSAQSWGAIGGVIKEGFGMFEDDVQVLELPGTLDRFVVQLQLKSFLRRMSITHSAVVEFIARGRLWTLQFFVVPPEDYVLPNVREETVVLVKELRSIVRNSNSRGSSGNKSEFPEGTWAVSLGLLEGSSPIVHGLTAQLVIPPAKTVKEPEHDVQIGEQDLVEEHLQSGDGSAQSSSRLCEAPLPARCSPCNESIEQKSKRVSAGRDADATSYLSRLLSRLVTNLPASQERITNGSVELNLQHYTNGNMFNNPDQNKSRQLLAPPLPPYPSIFSSDSVKTKGKDVDVNESLGREARARACAFDLLASFDDCEEAFDGGLHVDSDGILHAILEVQLIKRT